MPNVSQLMRSAAASCALLVSFAVAAEVGARADDRIFDGLPVLENPTFEGLFFTLDDGIRRGRPGAHWERVTFNNFGMRGPDIAAVRPKGCERWLFIGASETFGEPGVLDGDFPSHIRKSLPDGACVEIANTASPGLGMRGGIDQFAAYLPLFGATTVFVYPPTQSYLQDLKTPRVPSTESRATPAGAMPPNARATSSGNPIADLLSKSRFIARLKRSAEVPAPIQRYRRRRWIDAAVSQHPEGWTYTAMPPERLDTLDADMTRLVDLIRATGARPVLMTHAMRATPTPRPEDHEFLVDMRVYVPRATPEVFATYEYAAQERLRSIARRLDVLLVDVAAELSGRPDNFIDLVHFTPKGNAAIAALVLKRVPLTPPKDE